VENCIIYRLDKIVKESNAIVLKNSKDSIVIKYKTLEFFIHHNSYKKTVSLQFQDLNGNTWYGQSGKGVGLGFN
ncbi:hypothetical protein, partial [Paenibacillus sp. P3E]|uniref:hypothetical protein n=1 Tax=Paenibacillus sp. P3E TaxID=1349435 RepID=UPI001C4A0FF4